MKHAAPIKIILADDHSLFREGFRVMIKKHKEIELIEEAADGEELLNKVFKLFPDVVLTDIRMPKIDGLQVMETMREELPTTPVIALTSYDEENLIIDMLEAGAKGYLLKSANDDEIIEAIKTVVHDKTYYCHFTTTKLAHLIATSSFNPFRKRKKVVFNERELEIIILICKEFTNKEIADQLYLSKRTIETRREQILDKMEVKNTAGVVLYAVKHGIYKP